LPFCSFSYQKSFSQCFQIESILVDACDSGSTPSDEGYNEMVRFKVGSADINTSNLTVVWPSNSWLGLSSNATTKPKVDALNAQIIAAGGCGRLIQPTGGVLPANAEVILVTGSSLNVALNSFGAITQDIYIIFRKIKLQVQVILVTMELQLLEPLKYHLEHVVIALHMTDRY